MIFIFIIVTSIWKVFLFENILILEIIALFKKCLVQPF